MISLKDFKITDFKNLQQETTKGTLTTFSNYIYLKGHPGTSVFL